VTSPDSQIFTIIFGITLLASIMYASGRVHQWYRQGLDRDDAFRDGYDRATRSLFALATRATKASEDATAVVRPISAAPSARHRAEDRDSKTQALRPDAYGQWQQSA
jgi:hypothetical protein